jgi:hypothetical protein
LSHRWCITCLAFWLSIWAIAHQSRSRVRLGSSLQTSPLILIAVNIITLAAMKRTRRESSSTCCGLLGRLWRGHRRLLVLRRWLRLRVLRGLLPICSRLLSSLFRLLVSALLWARVGRITIGGRRGWGWFWRRLGHFSGDLRAIILRWCLRIGRFRCRFGRSLGRRWWRFWGEGGFFGRVWEYFLS